MQILYIYELLDVGCWSRPNFSNNESDFVCGMGLSASKPEETTATDPTMEQDSTATQAPPQVQLPSHVPIIATNDGSVS